MNPSAAQALAYIEMGLRPIPVPLRSKAPVIDEWQKLDIKREEVEKYFPREMNIGVLLGDGSKGVADVDLDTPEAVAVATIFLPTTAVFGRATNPRSHHVFYSRYAVTTKFVDHERQTLVELRANKTKDSGNGLQTIFPDSIHESGERIEWDADSSDGDIAEIKPEPLRLAVARIAVTAYLMRLGWAQEPAVAFAQAPDNQKLEHVDVRAAERIRRWLGIAVEKPRLQAVPTKHQDHDVLMKRASAYLARIPGAVAGNNGHDQTWDAALAMVRGFGLGEAAGLSLLSSDYNHRCDPPWEEKDLAHKAHDAANAAHVGRGWLVEDRNSQSATGKQKSSSNGGATAPVSDGNQNAAAIVPTRFRTVAEVLRSEDFKRPRTTTPTSIEAFDQLIGGGFKSRQLVVFAAPTGKGKTGLVGTLAYILSVTGVPVLWITTELDDNEQAARFSAIACRKNGTNATPDDFLSHALPAERGAELFDGNPLCLVNLDDPEVDALALIGVEAAGVQARFGRMPIIVVDYLQVLATEDPDRRRMSVSRVAHCLRRIARDFDTTVIAISSVSRAYYGKKDKKAEEDAEEDPRDWVAAAKESGDIEYACSVFGYLDTANKMNQLGESEARLIVAKSRAGVPGFVGLSFHGPSGAFVPADDAVARMQPQSRSRGPSDIERVVKFIRKHPGRTAKAIKCSVPGLGKDKIEVAMEQLEADGVIYCRQEEYKDSAKRVRMRDEWFIAAGEVDDDE